MRELLSILIAPSKNSYNLLCILLIYYSSPKSLRLNFLSSFFSSEKRELNTDLLRSGGLGDVFFAYSESSAMTSPIYSPGFVLK
jgi:hypothetical protein